MPAGRAACEPQHQVPADTQGLQGMLWASGPALSFAYRGHVPGSWRCGDLTNCSSTDDRSPVKLVDLTAISCNLFCTTWHSSQSRHPRIHRSQCCTTRQVHAFVNIHDFMDLRVHERGAHG